MKLYNPRSDNSNQMKCDTIFLRQLALSRFQAKILRENKPVMKKFSQKSVDVKL